MKKLKRGRKRVDFWSHVDRRDDDACWLWTGGVDRDGYGKVTLRSYAPPKTWAAHRLALHLLGVVVPAGLECDHTCKERRCCNPKHIEFVTHRENVLRSNGVAAMHARKDECQNGHAFSEENTYHRKDNGARFCRACNRARKAGRDPRLEPIDPQPYKNQWYDTLNNANR